MTTQPEGELLMYDRFPIVVEAEVIDESACENVVEATLDANEAFNLRRDAQRHHSAVERTLRQIRNAARLIALLVMAIVAILLCGCSDEKTWATVERDRHRIVNELTKSIPAEHHDNIQTIVFARPRQEPETASRGFVQASARVDQERIALAAAEAKIRAELRSVTNPAGTGELPPEFRAWQAKLLRARRMLLIAELAPSMNEWGPVLDQLINEELAGTPSKIVPRTLPASESLRLERARKAFANFLRTFEEVQP
jgi:hypothetical protein